MGRAGVDHGCDVPSKAFHKVRQSGDLGGGGGAVNVFETPAGKEIPNTVRDPVLVRIEFLSPLYEVLGHHGGARRDGGHAEGRDRSASDAYGIRGPWARLARVALLLCLRVSGGNKTIEGVAVLSLLCIGRSDGKVSVPVQHLDALVAVVDVARVLARCDSGRSHREAGDPTARHPFRKAHARVDDVWHAHDGSNGGERFLGRHAACA